MRTSKFLYKQNIKLKLIHKLPECWILLGTLIKKHTLCLHNGSDSEVIFLNIFLTARLKIEIPKCSKGQTSHFN